MAIWCVNVILLWRERIMNIARRWMVFLCVSYILPGGVSGISAQAGVGETMLDRANFTKTLPFFWKINRAVLTVTG